MDGAQCGQVGQRDRLASLARFDVAGSDEQSTQPRVESVGIAQSMQVSPRIQEGLLDSVAGEIRVAQDPERDGVEVIGGLGRDQREGILVTLSRQLDQRPARRSAHGADAPSLRVPRICRNVARSVASWPLREFIWIRMPFEP